MNKHRTPNHSNPLTARFVDTQLTDRLRARLLTYLVTWLLSYLPAAHATAASPWRVIRRKYALIRASLAAITFLALF